MYIFSLTEGFGCWFGDLGSSALQCLVHVVYFGFLAVQWDQGPLKKFYINITYRTE